MLKATVMILALAGLTACNATMSTTGSPDPMADVPTGGLQGAHPPNTARAGTAPW